MRTRHIIAILLTLCCAMSLQARQRTTRKGLKSTSQLKTTVATPPVTLDTLHITDNSPVRLSGYDKPLKSRIETLFATNLTYDTIRSITLRITYLDMHRRQLHSATHTLTVTIPPQSTRQIAFRSWDRQQSFYYILSARPRIGTATPYNVTCTPLSIVTDRRKP